MRKALLGIIFGFMLVLWAGLAAQAGVIDTGLESFIETLGPDEEVPVIIHLADQVELKAFKKEKDKAVRSSKIIKALMQRANSTQKSILAFLKENKAKEPLSLWIFNGIVTQIPASLVEEIAGLSGVERVVLDVTITLPPEPTLAGFASESALPEWNMSAIRAPELWLLGYDGTGVVVATMDSGVDPYHPDIEPNYRGGTNSWYDPNGQHATPYDADGHGTWVMGLMVGGEAGGTAIGVAPGAQWIAVKIFDDRGRSRLSRIHQGFQWLLDPDNNPATDDAPDVVNNSWYLSNTVNQCTSEFAADIAALKSVEIAVVFAGGNTGPNANTSVSPSNDPQSVAVGAVDASNFVAGFSGRGPSACDGSIYPALVAPGVSVRTADRTFGGIFPDSYTSVSGTSFAAPHVSGAMALLLSATPGATIAQLETALEESAVDLGAVGADNDHGHGLIDVVEAHNLLLASQQNPIASDDTYSLDQDTMLSVPAPGVLENDSDPQNDPLTASLLDNVTAGSLILYHDGSFDYTPDPLFAGTDSFTYTASDGSNNSNLATVSLTVNPPTPVNNEPVANDDSASTLESTAVTIHVLANDSDADGDAIFVSTVSQGANGAVVNNGSNVSYTPAPGFTGTDSFTYTASDGTDNSNVATVTITVNPAPANTPPVAVNDTATVKRNSSSNLIDVAANDYDPDGSIDASTVTIVTSPDNGGTASANADGTVTYMPKKGFRGTDTFTYTVGDNEGATSNAATVIVEVVK